MSHFVFCYVFMFFSLISSRATNSSPLSHVFKKFDFTVLVFFLSFFTGVVCLSLRKMKLKIYKITRGGSKVNCFITGKRADLLYYSKMLTDILSPSFLMLLRYTTRIKATTKCFFVCFPISSSDVIHK